MSGVDLYSSVLDDCSRPGDARIAPQAKKCCEIWANYDGNLLKLSVRQPVKGVRAAIWPTPPGAGVNTGQPWRSTALESRVNTVVLMAF